MTGLQEELIVEFEDIGEGGASNTLCEDILGEDGGVKRPVSRVTTGGLRSGVTGSEGLRMMCGFGISVQPV